MLETCPATVVKLKYDKKLLHWLFVNNKKRLNGDKNTDENYAKIIYKLLPTLFDILNQSIERKYTK